MALLLYSSLGLQEAVLPSKVRYLLLGLLLGFGVSIPFLSDRGYFGAVPYSYVTLHEAVRDGDAIHIVATFLKTDQCEFNAMGVFGLALGRWVELEWDDPDGPKGDRLEGYQTLDIFVKSGAMEYTDIEIRTRHDCDGKKVDKIFLSLDMSEVDG